MCAATPAVASARHPAGSAPSKFARSLCDRDGASRELARANRFDFGHRNRAAPGMSDPDGVELASAQIDPPWCAHSERIAPLGELDEVFEVGATLEYERKHLG